MSSYNAIEKANIVLEVLDKYDQYSKDVGFRQVLDEIITRWKEELQ